MGSKMFYINKYQKREAKLPVTGKAAPMPAFLAQK
jgi:hypothetical protein